MISNPFADSEPRGYGLKEAVLDTIKIEAPKTKYHSLTVSGILKLVKKDFPEFPDVTFGEVFTICKSAYDSGILTKHGFGYLYNELGD